MALLRCFCLRRATAVASSCAPALWLKRGSVGSSANAGLLNIAEKRASSSFACRPCQRPREVLRHGSSFYSIRLAVHMVQPAEQDLCAKAILNAKHVPVMPSILHLYVMFSSQLQLAAVC